MTEPRLVRTIESLIEHAVRKHGSDRPLVEVVLDNGERFATSEIYSTSSRFVVFEMLPTEAKGECSARIVPARRIRYINVYTDPATVPQPYAGTWTIGFRVHKARPA
jgi:hypothetical protein